MQINLRYSMRGEVHRINSVGSRGPQGHRVAAERFADAKLTMLERDLSINLYFAHLVRSAVLQRRQLLGKTARARLIASRRHFHCQSFMRSHVIVAVAPLVKPRLHSGEISKDSMGQYLDFQTAMKAFVFTLSLRMIRTTVTDRDTQPQQPNRQWRVLMRQVVTPGRAVVHQHPLGQAITAKSGRQLLLHGAGLLVAARLQAERITRMIVEHGQRMTALMIAQTKVALEIHLPELIRSLLFESLIRAHGPGSRVDHPFVTQQDRMHRALGQWSLASSFETRFDLARAPAVLITNR